MAASSNIEQINIAEFIDQALLNPLATTEQLVQCCQDADRYQFPAVCVYPTHVRKAVELLHNRSPQVCAVIGFPSGATTSTVKRYEAEEAAENGATELDVVINLGWLREGRTDELHREIAEICESTGQVVKAILEMSLLTPAEKKLAAEICMDAGVQFLKTSTGWAGGATVEDVALLKELTRDRLGIKASGGIKTIEQAANLILAGATRLGTSRGADLVRQLEQLHTGE
ncbi:MAG: deoxyribose-phosphate aldolase [Leptolyngbyaceae bacterium]|nr:deoxyribose-phosphate aldolase [Leptolyngbyaceae bacterium]